MVGWEGQLPRAQLVEGHTPSVKHIIIMSHVTEILEAAAWIKLFNLAQGAKMPGHGSGHGVVRI